MTIVATNLINFLNRLFFQKIQAITIGPFILLVDSDLRQNKRLINEERIHAQQGKELLYVFFWLLYLLDYAVLRLYGYTHYAAYKGNCFEREAQSNAHDLNYLRTRKAFAWTEYLNFTVV